MKIPTTSVLGSAVLVVAAVAIAAWAVSQLTGAEAAAERLPTIVVGRSVTEAAEPFGSPPGGVTSTSLGADGTTTVPSGADGTTTVPSTAPGGAGSGGSTGTSMSGAHNGAAPAGTTVRTSGVTRSTSATTPPPDPPPTTSAPAAPPTTARAVVPDPIRQQQHNQRGEGTPDASGWGTMSTPGGMGAPGSMGH